MAPARDPDWAVDLAREHVRATLFGGAVASATFAGRYRIERELGSGGMGTVLLAFDLRLRRAVAIKVLRNDPELLHGHARLRREASAMARAASVHVVPVFEVGVDAGRTFVVMEYVEGGTLRRWWTARPRSWQALLAVMMQAGEGLAAAHAADVIHRDFKPDNVLIAGAPDRGELARVVDFGLAGIGVDSSVSIDESIDLGHAETITRSGAVLGTPAYMAPESFDGRAIDPRADQFAFCVTLYEGLYGVRPFAGTTVMALQQAIADGVLTDPPAAREVPGWLRRAIVRGLAAEPAERWPDMRALLDALARGLGAPRRRRRAKVALGGVAVLLAIAAWAATSPASSTCTLDEQRFAGVWDEEVSAAIHARMLASQRPYAEDTHARVVAGLDAWTSDWRTQWRDACAASANGEQPQTILDLRMACLETRRSALVATTRLLADDPDPALVDRAVKMVAELPALDPCRDVEALRFREGALADESQRAEARAIDEALADAEALVDAGRYAQALDELAPWLVRARELDQSGVLARVLLRQGDLLRRLHREGSDTVLQEAAHRAGEAGDDGTAAAAWIELAFEYEARGEFTRGRELADIAAIPVGRTHDPHLEGLLANLRGILARELGEYDEARRQLELALELWTIAHGPESSSTAAVLTNLGNTACESGEFDACRAYQESALAAWEHTLGPEHPQVALALGNLGRFFAESGQLAEARACAERALAIDIAAFGPDDRTVGYDLAALSDVDQAEGRHAQSREQLEKAIAIFERTEGRDGVTVAMLRGNLGAQLNTLGETAAAREQLQRALSVLEAEVGAEHPLVAALLSNLGVVANKEGQHEQARALHLRALAIRRRLLGDRHPETANSLRNLAFVAHELGELDEADARYREALEILLVAFGEDHPDVASTREELGKIAAER